MSEAFPPTADVGLVREVVEAVSAGALVRRQLKLEEDPWALALVQRDLVWGQDRMVALLDSLLARYPIGSLLLCQAESATSTRPQGTSNGAEGIADAWTPQLVDGQQRSHALFSIFTGSGFGRFYVDLHADWTREGKYIEWRPALGPDDEIGADDETAQPPSPTRFLPVAKLTELTETGDRVLADAIGERVSDASLSSVLKQLAPELVIPLGAVGRAELVEKVNRVLEAWHQARIPVVTAQVEGPEDILELFTRVNRGGEPVSQNDLYFAAVKTFWHDPSAGGEVTSAKAALDGIIESTGGLIGVWTALSLVSRLALAGLGEGDIVPLKVDRLSRANKDYVVRAIRELSPIVVARLAPFMRVLRTNSTLKQALLRVHPNLWEEVLAWVVVSERENWMPDDTETVEAYLTAGTLFGYASKLRDPYRRDAFRVALDAAANGRPFPTAELRAIAWKAEGLRRGRASVLSSSDMQGLARSNVTFLVAAAQGLDDSVTAAVVDWDHIVPDSWRSKLRLPRGAGRWYREEVSHFSEPGNFWQIDLRANRVVQAIAPAKKFDEIEAFDPNAMGRVSPSRHSGISGAHLKRFREVGQLLDEAVDHAAKDAAAAAFGELIRDRNKWLVERIYESKSGVLIRSFGVDHPCEPVETPVLPADLAGRLGLTAIRNDLDAAVAAARKASAGKPSDHAEVLAMGGEWAERADTVVWLLREVTKMHAKRSGAGKSNWIQKNVSGQSIHRGVPILPLDAGDSIVLRATGQGSADGRTPFWLAFSGDSPNRDLLWEQVRASGEFEIGELHGVPHIPIRVNADMTWRDLLSAIDGEFSRLRAQVEGASARVPQ